MDRKLAPGPSAVDYGRSDSEERRGPDRSPVSPRGVHVQVSHYPRQENRTAWKVAAVVLGALVGFTPLLAPVHEFGHLWASLDYGCGGQILGWTHTSSECVGSGVVRMAGFWFELLVFGALVWWKRWSLPMGYITGTFLMAFISSDLNSPALEAAWMITAAPVLALTWWRYVKAPR